MSLQVWLPLTGDLRQQGLSNDIQFEINSGATISNNGKIGQCYNFDGVDDWIQAIHDKTMWSGKSITMMCWFKSDQSATGGTIVDIAADLCLGYTYSNSGIQFRFWRCYPTTSGTRTGHGFATTIFYNADQWHHAAAVFDGGVTKIYVDGALSGTWDYSDRYSNWEPLLGSSYNRISVGKSAGDHSWIGGFVNDVRIYDHALTENEIKEISRGLVLHYSLNDRYIEPTVNMITSLRAGGRTVVVDGDKIQNTGENVDTYFYLMNPGLVAGETYTISYYCQGLSESDPSWQFGVGAQSATHANHCGYIPIKNGWNELTFVCPEGLNGNTQLILDDYSATWRTTVVTFSNFQLEHNDHKTATQPLNTWYGAELTANTMINSSGAISSTSNWYTTDLIQITPGKSYTLTGLSQGGSGTYVALYNKSKTLSRVLLITANQDVTITASSSEYFFRTSIRNIAYELTTTAKLLYADEVIHDIGGFKNNGVITNSLTMSNDTVRYKVAAYFNGSSYITADYLPAETKTISLWVKIDTMPSTNSVLFADNKDDVASGLALGFFQGTYFITGTVSANYAVLNGTINIGEWNHICVVKTGTNNRNVYVNNTLLSNVGSNSWSHNSSKLWIGGRSYSSGAYFTGLMSDFRVYTTALSANDIKELYEMGVSG